jgi:hypothetical protein
VLLWTAVAVAGGGGIAAEFWDWWPDSLRNTTETELPDNFTTKNWCSKTAAVRGGLTGSLRMECDWEAVNEPV